MTKKQVFLLISLFLFFLLATLLLYMLEVHPALVTAESSMEEAFVSGAMGPTPISSRNVRTNGDWPTITPRSVSEPTATPQPNVHNQAQELQEEIFEQNNQETETAEDAIILPSPTLTPTSNQYLSNQVLSEKISPFSIGKSVMGAELWMYKFGNGAIEKLIVAGIHGGYEYNTTDLAVEMIAFIQSNPDIIPTDTTLYILPSFNPDGLNRSMGYAGRSNENNVDLNRNWDHNWKSNWDPAGCWAYLPITGGTFPFSEPETAALRDFIHSHSISAIISYHSAALGIFAGGAPAIDLSNALAETLAAVAPYPYPPIQTGCEVTGQFVDYAASYGIPAVDIELTNHKNSDFEINLPILMEFLAWSR
jgi:hypothetical protein